MKRSSLAALRHLGLLRLARELQRGRSVVLTYHGVLTGADDRHDFLNHNFVAAEAFEAHLRFLVRSYRPISVSDLYRCYLRGTPPPPRSVAITFDDGFANNHTVAQPLLLKHSFPFMVFLTTGMLDRPGAQLWSERVKRAIVMYPGARVVLPLPGGEVSCSLDTRDAREAAARAVLSRMKRLPTLERDAALAAVEGTCGRPPLSPADRERYDFLTWAQVRAMAATGVEFGSHTVTHPILSTLTPSSLQQELLESKQRIESELGVECVAFAYPNGSDADFGPREHSEVRAAGYGCAFSLTGRLNGARADRYRLDRVNIGRQFQPPLFEAAVTGILATARRAREVVRRRRHAAAPAGLEEARSC